MGAPHGISLALSPPLFGNLSQIPSVDGHWQPEAGTRGDGPALRDRRSTVARSIYASNSKKTANDSRYRLQCQCLITPIHPCNRPLANTDSRFMNDRSPPAFLGGPPAFPDGPPLWPSEDEEVLSALQAAYADRSWGRYDGPHSCRLVEQLRRMHGAEHVVLCSSGTIAVELALRGLKIGPGDEVILAAYDFAGNFRAVEAIGAHPVLVDLADQTWTLDGDLLPGAIGPQTKAIIVSHLHGTLAEMPRIIDVARAAGLAVVEDACQAPGAVVSGRVAGNWGDVGIHSFGGSKLLTAGRGGAILTANAAVAQRIRIYNQRGNEAFPLSELQAAVLAPQLAKLNERNRQREAAVVRLRSRLARAPDLITSFQRAEDLPAYYKLGLLYRPSYEACRPGDIRAAPSAVHRSRAGGRNCDRRGLSRLCGAQRQPLPCCRTADPCPASIQSDATDASSGAASVRGNHRPARFSADQSSRCASGRDGACCHLVRRLHFASRGTQALATSPSPPKPDRTGMGVSNPLPNASTTGLSSPRTMRT